MIFILWRKGYRPAFLVFSTIFGIYLLFLIQRVFFPLHLSGHYVDVMREQPLFSRINLIPFYYNSSGFLNEMLPGILQNILLTIPFGFGINFLTHIKSSHVFGLAVIIGVTLEFIQFILTLILQYPYRVIDINDVILNAIGVMIGYLLFRGFGILYLFLSDSISIQRNEISEYIYKVIKRT